MPGKGAFKVLPRERYYLLAIGRDYVRRFRPGEITERGERYHVHAAFPDALKLSTLVEAEEELDLLLTQLRTVPGYADLAGATVTIEQHEVFPISSATV